MSFKHKKPYTGVNAERYEMAPPNITPSVTIFQSLNSFLSNCQLADMQNVVCRDGEMQLGIGNNMGSKEQRSSQAVHA